MPSPLAYVFPPYRLMPDQRLLTTHDQPLKLGGRAFEALVVLVERRERTVSKNELLDLVWPKLVVEENNLMVQIGTLRKLLGHQAIATVPGRGYRFTLPVEVEGKQDEVQVASVGDGSPAPATSDLTVTNLPDHPPLLFGRDADVGSLRGMLDAHALVTIAGAGGIGKTRLAQLVAHTVRADFPGGVYWIDLAALSTDSLVAATVARALGAQVPSGRDATQVALTVIGQRRLLLIIDNCEHLLDGVTSFVDSIAIAPQLRLLITSQEVLRTPTEYVYRLGTLAQPAASDVESVKASGAGALFVARAQASDPRFVLTDANATAVREICQRLDGIPLAIELAAARMPLLGVEGVRSRLNERFNLLTAGARVVLRRHQTLRAALEWSHALLTPAEQAVFRRLGIFAGSFTLESAQRVADDDDIDAWDVLEHLGALVDKSLVLAEGEPVPRYRMLETTRLFALERLAEAGETVALSRRHVEATLALLQVYETPAKRDRSQGADRHALASEIDNVRAAITFAKQMPRLDQANLDLIGCSLPCFLFAQSGGEAFTLISHFRDSIDDALPIESRARYWLALARAGTEMGKAESLAAARLAASLYQQIGNDERRYAALIWIVAASARLREVVDVGPEIAEATRIERTEWAPRLRSNFQWAKLRWLLRQDRPEEALACAQKQVELVTVSGLPEMGRMLDGTNVAYCEMAAGHVIEAELRTRSALGHLGSTASGAGHACDTLMLILMKQGRFEEAVEAGRSALVDLRLAGDEFRLMESLGLIAAEMGRLEDAARIVGYVDHVMTTSGEVRWPVSIQNRVRLDALLQALPSEVRRPLMTEGAGMTGERAFEYAFGTIEETVLVGK